MSTYVSVMLIYKRAQVRLVTLLYCGGNAKHQHNGVSQLLYKCFMCGFSCYSDFDVQILNGWGCFSGVYRLQTSCYTAPDITVLQGCTNLWHQVTMATKFSTVAPSTCGSSVDNLLHATHVEPRILRCLLFL